MQILLIVSATTLLVLFGAQNSDHVAVSFIVGTPTKVRLIFLLLTSAATGFLFSNFWGLSRERRLKLDIRRLTELRRSTLARIAKQEREEDG